MHYTATVDVAVTEGIRVVVRTQYLPEQSEVRAGRFVFAYTIRISNESEQSVQFGETSIPEHSSSTLPAIRSARA